MRAEYYREYNFLFSTSFSQILNNILPLLKISLSFEDTNRNSVIERRLRIAE